MRAPIRGVGRMGAWGIVTCLRRLVLPVLALGRADEDRAVHLAGIRPGSRYTCAVLPRRIALWTLLAFGCATVRVPVTVPTDPADAAGTIAPPITELWLESSDEVPADVASSAEAQARAALVSALSGREIPATAAGASDAVLFVRERAVG